MLALAAGALSPMACGFPPADLAKAVSGSVVDATARAPREGAVSAAQRARPEDARQASDGTAFTAIVMAQDNTCQYAECFLGVTFPPAYGAEAVSGRVVDEATREPLEGVIVVAHWALMEDTGHADYAGACMAIVEVATDRDGRYSVAGWGPLPRPPKTFLWAHDPMLTLFKSGYEPLQIANELSSVPSTAAVRTSRWNGKTLALKRALGTLEHQAERLNSAYLALQEAHVVARTQQPAWTFFPHMFVALDAERRRLNAAGLQPIYNAGIPDSDDLPRDDRQRLRELAR
jgi:hypothetical protein